jgi:hypothetical protein
MKTGIIYFVFVSVLILGLSCNAQTDKIEDRPGQGNSDVVEVYYFHFTLRCVTCRTVESEARKIVETLYSQLYKDNKITFQAINLDEEEGKKLAEKFGVSGQSLLIVSGNAKADLIREGFMYARTAPEKFRQAIKQQIDEML